MKKFCLVLVFVFALLFGLILFFLLAPGITDQWQKTQKLADKFSEQYLGTASRTSGIMFRDKVDICYSLSREKTEDSIVIYLDEHKVKIKFSGNCWNYEIPTSSSFKNKDEIMKIVRKELKAAIVDDREMVKQKKHKLLPEQEKEQVIQKKKV